MLKVKIKKGDRVIVISGADKGKQGIVTAVLIDKKDVSRSKVVVEKINIRTMHIKPSQKQQEGGIKQQEKPIYVSKVMVVEPTGKKGEVSKPNPSRIGIRKMKDDKTGKTKTIRYLKKGNIEI